MRYARLTSLAACAAILAVCLTGASAQTPLVKPDGGFWTSDQGFSFARKSKKFRQAMSGVACPQNASGAHVCLAVFDEGVEARFFTIGEGTIHPDKKNIRLLRKDVELDAEGAATDGAFFYVTGSHSAQRNSCESNAGSRHVIRFRVDPETGLAQRDGRGGLVDYASSGRLWAIMAGVPELKAYVGEEMCLGTEPVERRPGHSGKRGVNIEGLAIRGGRLHFGFRGPARDGNAFVLSVDADALFGAADPRPKASTFHVGQGRAVRDLLAVSDGLLVLAGPDDDKANENAGWTLGRLHDSGGAATYRELATLDLANVRLRRCDKEIKPEAMTVLSDAPGSPYRLLVFSDGLCDGGPLSFTIPR